MEFKEIKRETINVDSILAKSNRILSIVDKDENAEFVLQGVREMQDVYNYCVSQITLGMLQHDGDTKSKENISDFGTINKIRPVLENVMIQFYSLLLQSKYKDEIRNEFGSQLLNIAKTVTKTINHNIIPLLQKENLLIAKYTRLMAAVRIEYKGEAINKSQLSKLVKSENQSTRREASFAITEAYSLVVEEADEIFDELVQIRSRIAKELGYSSFVELGYNRLKRTDYTRKDILQFRNQVRDYIVPLVTKIKNSYQSLKKMAEPPYYDEYLLYEDLESEVTDDLDSIMESILIGLDEEHEDFASFTKTFRERKPYDLLAKDGKKKGAYCVYIPQYKTPFIFTNLSEEKPGISTLIHEMGHAIQQHFSQFLQSPEYTYPTSELAEISSMGFELLGAKYLKKSISDLDKYILKEIISSIISIPYMAQVDEFQHYIYDNPDINTNERKSKWIELTKIYRPEKNYENNTYYNEGNSWHMQRHIFEEPFYYIDYALAQMTALDLYTREDAFSIFHNIVKLGGSKSYFEVLTELRLLNPLVESDFIKMAESLTCVIQNNITLV